MLLAVCPGGVGVGWGYTLWAPLHCMELSTDPLPRASERVPGKAGGPSAHGIRSGPAGGGEMGKTLGKTLGRTKRALDEFW